MTTYHFATVRGRKLLYRQVGDKNARTNVLLHGSQLFTSVSQSDSETRGPVHVIAPDYPGFGYSEAPAASELKYTFNALADHEEELLFGVIGLTSFSIYVQDYGPRSATALRHAIPTQSRVSWCRRTP